MVGINLHQQDAYKPIVPEYYSVKESVFPFAKFPEADPILGPEMKSTGEVMGTGRSFAEAYAKAQLASGVVLPKNGTALISVRDRDKPGALKLAKILIDRGFHIVATDGTARYLAEYGIECRRVNKVREGRPHIVDMIKNSEITFIVNTTEGKHAGARIAFDSRRGGPSQGHVLHDHAGRHSHEYGAGSPEWGRCEQAAGFAQRGRGMTKVPITVRGAEKLREEGWRLKSTDRPRIVTAIAEARAHGDLRENAEYHAAKEEQGFIEARIRDIEAKLSNAEIIDVTSFGTTGRVIFGATVELLDEDDGRELTYRIVGVDEADIASGRFPSVHLLPGR